MSLFLSDAERTAIEAARRRGDVVVGRFGAALTSRVARRAASPGLLGLGEDAAWWYPAAEYLSDAAMAFALEPNDALRAWLRDTALSVARRPVADWVGPWYRDHRAQPPLGHLETAHLSWGLGSVVDLAGEVFRPGERREAENALRAKGITLCLRWLECNSHLANWRAVMTAGVAVAAAVTGDREQLEYAADQTRLCAQAFQPDGSYAESLQYANYLAYALMLAYEAVHRTAPEVEVAGPEIYGRSMPWFAQSMLYRKPLSGWGGEPRARAVNFNDCGAAFRPSGDLLLQVAARCRDSLPTEASLARWLFDTFYASAPSQSPHNLATFGLRNDWGFLTLPFLTQSARPLSPEQAGLPTAAGFANGNVLVRDRWNGRTVLAVQAGSEPLYGPGHLHGDLNSFLLVHNDERLLADPGHSCYRNLIHGLESSTQTHNTCTFLIDEDALGLQEDLAKASLLEQSNVAARREIAEGKVAAPAAPRGRRLLVERRGEVTAVGSDAARLYGEPIREFSRFWIQAGSHVLFVVDRIRASKPVRTVWNWLLNNRDGASEIDVITPREILLRRGPAGMRMVHLGDGRLSGPIYAYVHDAYHPEPNQLGEGRPGSGMLYRWIEPTALDSRLVVHAFAVDDCGLVGDWRLETVGDTYALGKGDAGWSLEVAASEPLRLVLESAPDRRRWQLVEEEEGFSFADIEND
ncbi:MAG TPA: heparinase II/III family protein [Thermoguttaceae bacterium]|nr:heparinase II/III family protein [Thermoguttaceae bacterium]